MKHKSALKLTDTLLEIQRILTVLNPLINVGRDEFKEFSNSLDNILSQIFPTYNVAIVGPVGSGKSTLLTSLIKESGKHPISSINPSNEGSVIKVASEEIAAIAASSGFSGAKEEAV